MRHRGLGRLILLVFWCVGVAAVATAQERFAVECCQVESGVCRQGECVCQSWKIKLYSSNGSEWGDITGKSLESVQGQLKRSQDFDRRWEKFAGISPEQDSLSSQHPGSPICVQECPQQPWPWVSN